MTPEEIIESLKRVKEFEPRPFIIAICDAAIAFVQATLPVDVAATSAEAPAPEVSTPPTDEPVSTGKAAKK